MTLKYFFNFFIKLKYILIYNNFNVTHAGGPTPSFQIKVEKRDFFFFFFEDEKRDFRFETKRKKQKRRRYSKQTAK